MASSLSGSTFRNGGPDLSTSRKPTKFVVTESIDPASRETRMKWLYNTISSYGLDYEFSEASRRWIQERVATHDMSTRRDRSGSGWWERDGNLKSGLAPESLPNIPTISSTSSLSNSSLSSTGGSSSNQITSNRSPQELITNRPLFDAFIEQVEPMDEESLLIDFLDIYITAKFNSEATADLTERTTVLHDVFIEIQRSLFGSSSNNIFNNALQLSSESQRSMRDKLDSIVRKGRKLDVSVDNLSIFDDLVDAIFRFYEGEIVDFFNSDCSNIVPEAAQPVYASGGSEYAHNVARLNFNSLFTAPFPSWDNTNSYKSATVSVRFGRGPMIQGSKASGLYVLITSGSRMYRGNCASGAWNETFTLPISPTTQSISIVIGHGNKAVGFLVLSLSEMNARPEVGTTWFDLRTEEQPGLPVGPGLGTPFGDMADLTAMTSANQITVEWKLTGEEAPPCLEKYKNIYVDETATGGLGDFIRGKVSKKKKRFSDDNFNLDLTYILPNIIAMGFPSEGTEGMYRNPLKQVQQFFQLRHPKCYRIYNLCSERVYDHAKFEHAAQHFPFHDHNPPPFTLIKEMCESARNFLAQHPQNVVSIHCKAGKGRTGTMIAALLVYSGHFNATTALEYFGKMRTSNSKGVTIPSQIRYVHYFDQYCNLRRANKPTPGQTTLFLSAIKINNIGKGFQGADIFFSLVQLPVEDKNGGEAHKGKSFVSRKIVDPKYVRSTNSVVWDFGKKLVDLSEDFKLEFQVRNSLGNKDKLFQCWFNTRFMKLEVSPSGEPHILVPKSELDKAVKDCKSHKKYPANMHLEMVFSNVATATRIKEEELLVK